MSYAGVREILGAIVLVAGSVTSLAACGPQAHGWILQPDQAGAASAPSTPPGTVITGVEIELEFENLSGGTEVRLHYDENLDGIPDASAPLEFHLAHPAGEVRSDRWSCPAVLDGAFRFRFDPNEKTLHEDERSLVARFTGLRAGGSFHLELAGQDAGAPSPIRRWDVAVRTIAG